jgi:Uma2 family endonuclease
MSTSIAPPDPKLITGEELLAMGDVGPCELIDGRIVPMSPTGGEHAFFESNLGFELTRFARQSGRGWVMVGEVGIYIRRNPDRVRAADVAFISNKRSPQRPSKGFLDVAPELVVEVMSPDDRWQDVRQKLEDYFSIGVEWVWVVEPDNRTILVYSSITEMQKFAEPDTLIGTGVLAGFTLLVTELFAE